jgi:hypothetical protein
MFGLIVLSVGAALVAGLVVKLALDSSRGELLISWTELGIGMAIISLIVAPLTSRIGWSIAKRDLLSYNEYRNGWETRVVEQEIACSRDGPCIHTYQCDPYRCNPRDCNCRCLSRDENGYCTSRGCDTCWDTCHHDCPYATHEFNYIVVTTVGNFTIGDHHFAAFPVEWRPGGGIPGDVPRGAPRFWLDAKARIDAGLPGPVTKRARYDNYILASERTILKQHSDMIEQYLDAEALPPVHQRIYDFYYADKASFVGFTPGDAEAWQTVLMGFNAALGSELGGDLHLVIAQDPTISSNPDAYTLALKAYWQSSDVWGDDCLSKNGILVVIGTGDGQTVSWARAETGMPLGNEQMRVAIRNALEGVDLAPQSVLGKVEGEFYVREQDGKLAVHGIGDGGALRTILWGLDDPETKFVPVSMTADDPGDVAGGFLYLDSEIQPKPGQRAAIVVAAFIFSSIVWVVLALVGERRRRRRSAHP